MDHPSRFRRLVALGGRFLVVGGLSTAIEVCAFNAFVYLWGWDVVAAKVIASLIALVNAYFGNREWTFRHRGRRGRMLELSLFAATNLACTGLGAVLVWLGVTAFTLIAERAPGPVSLNGVNLASIMVVVLARFILYHLVVFRSPMTSQVDHRPASARPE